MRALRDYWRGAAIEFDAPQPGALGAKLRRRLMSSNLRMGLFILLPLGARQQGWGQPVGAACARSSLAVRRQVQCLGSDLIWPDQARHLRATQLGDDSGYPPA